MTTTDKHERKEKAVEVRKETRKPEKEAATRGKGRAVPIWVYAVAALIVLVIAGSVAYSSLYLPSQNTPVPTTSPQSPSLNEAKNYSLPLGAKETGLESCSEGKIKVLLFHDPYCAPCAANEYIVNKFYEKYGDKADIQYRFVIANSRKMIAEYGLDMVYQAQDYHVCAQENGVIQEFKKCFYDSLKTDGVKYIPLDSAELNACAKSVGMDELALGKCLPTARKKVDEQLAEAFELGGGTYFTPMAVVDCRYKVNSALVEQTYCAVAKTC
ncbi:hypothetical protein HZC09_02930 [Candidatus Micrarchaeota archaeon]|nr:hypothetical protein [Candidatus Micrarchaeota archaeon]